MGKGRVKVRPRRTTINTACEGKYRVPRPREFDEKVIRMTLGERGGRHGIDIRGVGGNRAAEAGRSVAFVRGEEARWLEVQDSTSRSPTTSAGSQPSGRESVPRGEMSKYIIVATPETGNDGGKREGIKETTWNVNYTKH